MLNSAEAVWRRLRCGINRGSRKRMVGALLKQAAEKGRESISEHNWDFVQECVASDRDLARYVEKARFPFRTKAGEILKQRGLK